MTYLFTTSPCFGVSDRSDEPGRLALCQEKYQGSNPSTGRSVEAVARELDSDVETVRGWLMAKKGK
jgi:hypothetical protein